ncbi:unnamed protein product [Victoria cruziana]
MGDWQEMGQSVLLGLIFSFLVAKLFSVAFAFRDENLRVVREETVAFQATGEAGGATASVPDPVSAPEGPSSHAPGGGGVRSSTVPEAPNCAESSMEEKEEDDDWEGVESTELDEEFTAATTFIAAASGDPTAQKVPNDVQLQLYGYYKIATEGPCRVPQPSALKVSARAKWNAWQRFGTMSPEEAMQNYINIVNEMYPTWSAGGSSLDAIHIFAREGDIDSLLKQLEHGVPVNLKGMYTCLLGFYSDNEGQTPLHYAVLCERQAICEYLIKSGGDLSIVDNDGSTPRSLCTLMWPCMQ